MTNLSDLERRTFREFERTGWQDLGPSYHAVTRDSTAVAAGHLLDAIGAAPGARLLDVACGPGYAAGEAAARGLDAVGIDFVASMVAEARRAYPAARFGLADAEALPFADGAFDALVCAFGLLHFAAPERAAAEAHRVLAPGGAYAFTVWCTPDRVETFGLFRGAVEAHGTLDVDLPEGPPMFRFADPAECLRLLADAGFAAPVTREILIIRRTTPERILDGLAGATVRSRALIAAQAPAAQAAIRREILARARAKARDGVVELSMPAVLASARKV